MKKKILIIAGIIVLLILLVPTRTMYKDGGSVRYKALLYDITKYHELNLDSPTGYNDGLSVKVLGISIVENRPEGK